MLQEKFKKFFETQIIIKINLVGKNEKKRKNFTNSLKASKIEWVKKIKSNINEIKY